MKDQHNKIKGCCDLSQEAMDALLKDVQEHQRVHPNHFSDDYRLELIEIIKASLTKCNAE